MKTATRLLPFQRPMPPNSHIKCYEDLLVYYNSIKYIVTNPDRYFVMYEEHEVEKTFWWAISRIKELHLYPRKRTSPPSLLTRLWNHIKS